MFVLLFPFWKSLLSLYFTSASPSCQNVSFHKENMSRLNMGGCVFIFFTSLKTFSSGLFAIKYTLRLALLYNFSIHILSTVHVLIAVYKDFKKHKCIFDFVRELHTLDSKPENHWQHIFVYNAPQSHLTLKYVLYSNQ